MAGVTNSRGSSRSPRLNAAAALLCDWMCLLTATWPRTLISALLWLARRKDLRNCKHSRKEALLEGGAAVQSMHNSG